MALDLSSFPTYVKENRMPLILKALTGAKSASLMNVQPGIKSSENLNFISSDAVFQAGGSCGFTSSGTTATSDRTITVGKIKVQESFCEKDLESKWTQELLKPGSHYEGLTFEEAISAEKSNNIAKALETAIWQGDTTSGTANLSKFDGLLKLIDAAGTAVVTNAKKGTGTITSTTGAATVSGSGSAFTSEVGVGDKIYSGTTLIGTVLSIGSATALTLAANGAAAVTGATYTIVPAAAQHFATPVTAVSSSNVVAIHDNIFKAFPAELLDKDKKVIFEGWDTFRTLTLALKDANMFHYDGVANNAGELMLPGTDIKVIAVHGLTGTNRVIGGVLDNYYIGTDLEHEEEDFRFWYSQDDDNYKMSVEFKYGTQVAFPDQIVSFRLAA